MAGLAERYGLSNTDAPQAAEPKASGSLAERYNIAEKTAEAAPAAEDKSYSVMDYAGHIAGGFNKAIVDTVNLPLAASRLLSDATGLGEALNNQFGESAPDWMKGDSKDLYDLPLGVGEFLKAATARAVPEGESMIADAARTATEWGAFGPLTAARNLATKAPMMRNVADDLAMGVGAATGEAVADDVGEVGGELTGGVLGLLAALKGKPVLDWAVNKIPQSLGSTTPLPTKAEKAAARHEQGALDLILGNLGDEAAAKGSLVDSLERGRTGTTLDALNDQGVNVVERVVKKQAQGQNAITKALRAQEAEAVDILGEGTFGATSSSGAQRAAHQGVLAEKALIDANSARELGTVTWPAIGSKYADDLAQETRSAQALGDAQEGAALQNALRGKRANEESLGAGLNELTDIDSVILANEKAVQDAINTQESLAAQTAGTRPTAEASETAVSALKEGKAATREAKEAPLWKAYDDGTGFSAQQLQGSIKEAVAGLPPEAVAGVKAKYPTFFKDIDKMDWKTTVSPQSVSYVISQVKSDLKAKGKEHWGTNEKNLSKAINNVEEQVSALNPAYGAAKDMTREILQQYGPSKVVGAGKGTNEEFLSKLMGGGADSQTAAIRQLKGTKEPEAIKAGEDWIRRQNKNKTIDQKFLDENEGVLTELPTLRKEYEDIAAAGGRADKQKGLTKAANMQLEKEARKLERQQEKLGTEGESIFPKARQAAIEAQNKATKAKETATEKSGTRASIAKESALTKAVAASNLKKGLVDKTLAAKYVNDPVKTVQAALIDTSRTKGDLGKLYENMKAQGQGEAFKGSVRDAIMDKYTTKASGRGVSETVAGVADSVHKMRSQLVDNGILTTKEFDEMTAIIDYQAKGKGLRKETTDLDTGVPAETRNLESSMIAAAVNKAMPIGQGLVMTGAIKRFVAAKMTESMLHNPETRRYLSDFMANPQKFADRWDDIAVKRFKDAKSPESKGEMILKALTNRPIVESSATDNE